MPERLRYGGFIVRVYSGGKLQDERSQPESLISQLRSNAPQPQSPTPMIAPIASPTAVVAAAPPAIPPSSFSPPPPATPTQSRSPVQTQPVANDQGLPYGKPVPGKPGFVSSPYDAKFLIDVRGFPPGTLVNDPNTNKPFRVP
jgi:hypothetical protein